MRGDRPGGTLPSARSGQKTWRAGVLTEYLAGAEHGIAATIQSALTGIGPRGAEHADIVLDEIENISRAEWLIEAAEASSLHEQWFGGSASRDTEMRRAASSRSACESRRGTTLPLSATERRCGPVWTRFSRRLTSWSCRHCRSIRLAWGCPSRRDRPRRRRCRRRCPAVRGVGKSHGPACRQRAVWSVGRRHAGGTSDHRESALGARRSELCVVGDGVERLGRRAAGRELNEMPVLHAFPFAPTEAAHHRGLRPGRILNTSSASIPLMSIRGQSLPGPAEPFTRRPRRPGCPWLPDRWADKAYCNGRSGLPSETSTQDEAVRIGASSLEQAGVLVSRLEHRSSVERVTGEAGAPGSHAIELCLPPEGGIEPIRELLWEELTAMNRTDINLVIGRRRSRGAQSSPPAQLQPAPRSC